MVMGLSGVQFFIVTGLVEYNSGSDRASNFKIDRALSARQISQAFLSHHLVTLLCCDVTVREQPGIMF